MLSVKERKVRNLGYWDAFIPGTAVQAKGISNATAENISRRQLRATDPYGFSPLSIDVEPEHALPAVAHGGKLFHSMIARFNT